MATLSLVLDKSRQKKDGSYPLVFQVILKTVPVKISTGISVKEEDFDRKNDCKFTFFNYSLINKIALQSKKSVKFKRINSLI
jgi:hypothetical protein